MTVGGMALDDALNAEVTGDEYAAEILAWIRTIVGGVMGDPTGWDEKFVPYLTSSWPLERLAATDKATLRMACYELWKLADTPPKVTISEYVEIAKKYGAAESGKFVNGVLAAVLKVCPKAEWKGPPELEPAVAEAPVAATKAPPKAKRKPTVKWVVKSDG